MWRIGKPSSNSLDRSFPRVTAWIKLSCIHVTRNVYRPENVRVSISVFPFLHTRLHTFFSTIDHITQTFPFLFLSKTRTLYAQWTCLLGPRYMCAPTYRSQQLSVWAAADGLWDTARPSVCETVAAADCVTYGSFATCGLPSTLKYRWVSHHIRRDYERKLET
jgi:hypothetical protein